MKSSFFGGTQVAGSTPFDDSVAQLSADEVQTAIERITQGFGIPSLENLIHVAKNGDNATADGAFTRPFLTVSAAIDYINNNLTPSESAPVAILIAPGVYAEQPLTLPEFSLIQGYGPRSFITAANPNANLLTMEPNTSIRSIALSGVTNTANWLVSIESTNGGQASLLDIFITNTTNGIRCTNTTGTFRLACANILATAESGAVFQTNDNVGFTISAANILGNNTSTICLQQNGTGTFSIFNLRIALCDIGLQVNGTGKTTLSGVDFADGIANPIDQQSTGEVLLIGGNLNFRETNVTNLDSLKGYFLDRAVADNRFTVLDELRVGLPNAGRESSLGEGDSYHTDVLVYEFNGSTFTDKSTEAFTGNGQTFAIPGTAVNNAVYVASDFPPTSPKFQGVKVDVATAAVGGEIVSEYWDGSAWVEVNTMSEATVTNGYQKYGNVLFARAQQEQVFFDRDIINDWVANDPVSYGKNLFWVRFRVATALTTAPIFNALKVHSNKMLAATDGFVQYFGEARRIKSLSTDIRFEGTVNVPADQDVYLGDFLSVGKNQNEFFAAGLLSNSDLAGAVFKTPTDMDTSCKALLQITYYSTDTGTLELFVDWSPSRDGDIIYESAGAAPTNGARQQTVVVQDSYPVADRQKTFTVPLDVSTFIARGASQRSDLFWVSINISNNTTVNPMTIVNLALEYVSNESGGHL